MKALTAILCVLLVLAAAFCAYFYIGGTLAAQVNCVSAGAAAYPEAFETIKENIAEGNIEKLYINEDMTNTENYTLMDITVQLANRGFFDAEWVSVELAQVSGDIALYSVSGVGTDVAAGGMQSMNLKLVTRATEENERAATIRYYVCGIERSIKINF